MCRCPPLASTMQCTELILWYSRYICIMFILCDVKWLMWLWSLPSQWWEMHLPSLAAFSGYLGWSTYAVLEAKEHMFKMFKILYLYKSWLFCAGAGWLWCLKPMWKMPSYQLLRRTLVGLTIMYITTYKAYLMNCTKVQYVVDVQSYVKKVWS